MKNKILSFAILASLFLGCNWDYEKFKKLKKANLTFEKLIVDNKTIYSKQLLAQIQGKEKEGFIIKSIAISDSEIAKVEGTKPYFSITIKKAVTFKATIILEKDEFLDAKIENCEIDIKTFTFSKLKISNGRTTITKNEILEQIQGLSGLGYQIKNITTSDFDKVEVLGTKPNFSLKIKKAGSFTATIILEKSGFLDVKIENCEFDIKTFTFQKMTIANGRTTITKNEILAQIRGLSGLGYQIKNITISDFDKAEVQGTKPNFSLKIKKAGNFNAKIILEKDGFLDAKIAICKFSYVFDFTYYGMACSIIETADGNLVVAGSNILKIDNTGNKIWENKNVSGNDIIQTADGNLVVAGGRYRILKLDKTGNKIWEKTYGGSYHDQARSIIETADGNLVVAGSNILKIDNTGNKIWEYKNVSGNDIIQTADGNLVVAGDTYRGGGGHDKWDLRMWILKLDNIRNYIWEKTYGDTNKDVANSIIETADDNWVVAGYKKYDNHDKDMWILKLNKTGNKIWEKTYVGSNLDGATSIIETADGHLVVTGNKGLDMWILKLDNTGNKIWEKTYGGSYQDQARSIIETADGHLVVAGKTKSKGAGSYDFRVLKLYGNDGAIVGSR